MLFLSACVDVWCIFRLRSRNPSVLLFLVMVETWLAKAVYLRSSLRDILLYQLPSVLGWRWYTPMFSAEDTFLVIRMTSHLNAHIEPHEITQ